MEPESLRWASIYKDEDTRHSRWEAEEKPGTLQGGIRCGLPFFKRWENGCKGTEMR